METIKYNLLLAIAAFCLFCTGSFAQDFKCLDCHDNLIASTAHDKVVGCGDCHRDVVNEDHTERKAKTVDCGKCHIDLAEQVENDIHRRLVDSTGNGAPTCKMCHGKHNIKVVSIVENKSEYFCKTCHKGDMLTAPYHTLKNLNESCTECHSENDHKTTLEKSVHAKLSCSNCHGYVINNLEHHEKNPANGQLADCYLCHNAIAAEHKESIHGLSITAGMYEAAQCWNCHGSHSISHTEDKESMVYPTNLVSTCGACHDDLEFIKSHDFSVKQPGKMYSTSVHGKLVEEGRLDAATCVTCHGVHNIKNRIQVGSKISSINLPETCSECHKEITEEYYKSIHWIGVKKGVRDSPTCNGCHSEHSIHAINTVNKRDEMREIQEKTCLQCHQNLMLSERYGMEGGNAKSYQDSYHGMAVNRGDKDAAMCVDCHGVHNILPKFHEESTISEKNLITTCGKCHKNVTENFTKSYSHVTDQKTQAAHIENIVGSVYFWLIVIVVGGMMIHNLIIFIYDLRERQNQIKKEIRIPRFTTNELIQHFVLLITFAVLAITGFQLKYGDSWWSQGLSELGLNEINRQYTHRVAAVLMILLSVYHVIYLVVTARGRSVLRSLWPRLCDIGQAIHNVLFYLRIKKNHPEFDNYSYMEKIEYWALIWGTLVMGFTGFILWFPTVVGDWAPIWTIKVCEIVHFYEAILATLAIIIWHWFFVIFRPQEYPLSFTCIDGKMTIIHFKDEHRLRFKKIVVEWLEVKSGKKSINKINHLSKVFISAIEKTGIKADDFFQSEIEKDPKLKTYLQDKN